MPIYEYLCEKCEREFEREQRISDPPISTCPYCRSRRVKKLISRTSFVLKGGGWYSDLYSSSKPGDSKRDAEKTDSGSASGSADASASSETKSETPAKAEPVPKSKPPGKGGKSAKGEKKKPRSGASGKSAA